MEFKYSIVQRAIIIMKIWRMYERPSPVYVKIEVNLRQGI